MNVFSWFKKQPPHVFDIFEAKPPDRPLDGFAPETLREAQRRYQEAHKLATAGDDPGAIVIYTSTLELVPVFWEALDNRGFCYMREKQFNKAVPDFEMAAQLNPNSHRAFIALIKCYQETRHSDKATPVVKYCKEKWPQEDVFPDWSAILQKHA